jgi:transmembrane sensor
MSNVIELSGRISIEEEACVWVAKIDRQLTALEENQFKNWITSSAQHYKTFMQVAEHWDKTEALQLSKKDLIPPKEIAYKKPYFYRPALAASFFFLAVVSFLMSYPQLAIKWQETNSQETNGYAIEYSESFSTENMVSSSIQLPDGSRLRINAKSVVDVSFSKKIREIKLKKGELFIEVAHDTQRPLVVVTKDHFVRAVGTAFNVNLVNEKETRLTVVEGKVVYGKANEREEKNSELNKGNLVVEGEQTVLNDVTVKKLSQEELERELSWKQGVLVFTGQPLKEVLVEVQRYTQYQFIIGSSSIETLQVVGYFKAGDVTTFLAALKGNFQIDHRMEKDNKILLFKAMP